MKLDHIAYRVKSRQAAADLLRDFGYQTTDYFVVPFDDGTIAKCSVLTPLEGPEVFISEGSSGSIVSNWVNKNGNGIHHIAYAVDSIEKSIAQFRDKGIEFLSDDYLTCDNLHQIFTKPNALTGTIYELLQLRGDSRKAFCTDNVKNLMLSTEEL